MYDDYIVTQIKELKENGKPCEEIYKIMNIPKASVWVDHYSTKKCN